MVKDVKAMPRRISSSSKAILIKNDDDDDTPPFPQFLVGMPPWYVRVFLYGMMLLCFAMVFFMESPDARIQRQQNEQAIVAGSNDQSIQEGKSIFDQSIIDRECRRTNTRHAFTFCGLRSTEIDNDYEWHLMTRSLKEILDKKSEIGLIDIGNIDDGGYLALYVATASRHVLVKGGDETRLRQLRMGSQANHVIDYVKIFNFDQIASDQQEKSIKFQLNEIVKDAAFKEAVLRIDLAGRECNAFEKSDSFFSTIKVIKVFLPWRADPNRQECQSAMISKLKSLQLTATSLHGDILNWDDWKSWPTGHIIFSS